MAVQLFINGVEQTNFILNAPYKDTIDEELDHLNFQIKSSTRLDYKKGDKIRYIVKHNSATRIDKIFCLFECVETLGGSLWTYQVSCLSPTKLLENLIVNGLADTYASLSMLAQINRVKDKLNAQFSLEGVGITLQLGNSVDLATYNIASKDFLWDGQTNVREIFNDMFEVADCICVASDFEITGNNITSITIESISRNKSGQTLFITNNDIENGGLNDVSEVVKGITINRNSEYACGNIVSLIKNGVAKDNVQQTYMSARNTDLTIDNASDWHIVTQEPIYSLNKVYALMPLNNIFIDYWDYEVVDNVGTWVKKSYSLSNDNPTFRILAPVDITEYIVEKDVFDAMSVDEQSRHLYFKRGEKGIYNLYSRYKWSALITKIALRNVMGATIGNLPCLSPNANDVVYWGDFSFDRVFYQWNSNSQNWEDIKNTALTSQSAVHLSSDGTRHVGDIAEFRHQATPFVDTTIAYEQAMFSVNYQPYVDSVVKIEKSSVDFKGANLSVLKNQSERTIDASKYYDSQKSLIERMGNKEMFLDAMIDLTKTYNYETTLWDLGTNFYLSGVKWTITQREVSNYNENMLKVRYTFSKSFNASNVDIQLKRDKRLYGIPLSKYVDRYIILNYNGNLNNVGKMLLQCWDDFTGSATTMGYCLLEAVKIGNATITNKVAGCKDNYAVDVERTKYSSTIVNVNLRYCDNNGFKEDVHLYVLSNDDFNNVNISDYSRLPFIPNSDISNELSQYGTHFTLTGVKKDKMERLIFVLKP